MRGFEDTSRIDFSDYIRRRALNFSSRNWIFKRIDDWLLDRNGSRFFIITGAPGSGKTALAARLAQFSGGDIAPPQDSKVIGKNFLSAIHFCSSRDRRWLHPNVFSSSVALQLAGRYPAFAKSLLNTANDRSIGINVHMKVGTAQQVTGVLIENISLGDTASEDAFLRLVREPLEQLLQTEFNEQIILMVDALDEALSYEGKVGIGSLISQVDYLPASVRFVLTCRPEVSVRLPFRRATATEQSLSSGTGLINSQDDVREYALAAVEESAKLRAQLAAALKAERLAAIVSAKSNGNFLYARYFMQMLNTQPDKITEESLHLVPEGLDGIYREFLDRFVNRAEETWQQRYAPVLGTLSVAEEPLDELTLAHFTNAAVPETRRRLVALLPWLQFDESLPPTQRRYAIYHRSFADFLLDPDQSEAYWCDEATQHRTIAAYYLGGDRAHMDSYGLRNLARHLRLGKQFDELFGLARDREFREEQAALLRDDPEAPLRTLEEALIGGAETDRAGEMVEFMIARAGALMGMTKDSPLDALRAGSVERARSLAHLYPDENRILWNLLLIWELQDTDRYADANATLEQLLQSRLSRLIGWQGSYAVTFLPHVLKLDPNAFETLQREILDENLLPTLCAVLADGGNQSVALEIARSITGFLRPIALRNISSALTTANRLDAALETAREIEDGPARANALSEIAAAYFRSHDQTTGGAILQEAMEAAGDSPYALANISAVLGQIGDRQGGKSAALRIFRSRWLPKAIGNFAAEAVKYGKISPDEGRAFADMALGYFLRFQDQDSQGSNDDAAEPDNEFRSSEVNEKLSAETAELLAGAQQNIERADAERGGLAAIARVLSMVGAAKWNGGEVQSASEAFAKAKTVAEAISWEPYRVSVFCELAEGRGEAGDKNGAVELFEDAVKTAQGIEFGNQRVQNLTYIALAQRPVFDLRTARTNLAIAVQAAADLEHDWDLPEAFAAIAAAELKFGDRVAARKFYSDGLTIRSSGALWSRCSALAQVAKTQANRDGNGEKGRRTFRHALAVARQIRDADQRDSALLTIATAQGESGILEGAAETTEEIRDQLKKARAFATLGWALATNGNHESGSAMLAQAAQMAEEDADALGLIAVAQWLIDDKPAAEKTFNAAIEIASAGLAGMGNAFSWWGLSPIAEKQVQIHDFDGALKTARCIGDDWFKWKTIGQIAREQASAGDVLQALETAETIRATGTPAGILVDASLQAGDDYPRAIAALIRSRALAEIAGAKAAMPQPESSSEPESKLLAADILTRALATFEEAKALGGQVQTEEAQETLAAIAAAQMLTGQRDKAELTFAAALDSAMAIQNEVSRESTLAAIAVAEANSGLGDRVVRTANLIFKHRDAHYQRVAHALANSNDRENLKRLLPAYSAELAQSYGMCEVLTRVYPEQADQFASALISLN